MIDVDTPQGPARVHLHPAPAPRAGLVLGHGAGGSVGARDIVAATKAAVEAGVTVALVEQPYRVAGRKSPPPAPRLDEAWVAVIERVAAQELHGLALVTGGRSSGARVACRTAAATGAVAVLCLAFPLRPPRGGVSRQDELDGAGVPVLVVQGEGDPFGMPEPGDSRAVVRLKGTHALTSDLGGVAAAVRDWLPGVIPPG